MSDTNAPTMAEECYIISRKKSRYFKLREQLKKLENRFDMLDDDLIELKREIDDIKKIISTKNKYRGEAFPMTQTVPSGLLCNNTSSDVYHMISSPKGSGLQAPLRGMSHVWYKKNQPPDRFSAKQGAPFHI